MKIGVCTSIDNLEKVQAMGFDYMEPTVVSITGMDESTFNGWVEKVQACPIKCESFNVLLPGGLKVAGPNADLGKLRDYLSGAFQRVAKLGGQIVVFGSGGARTCPEGWSIEQAASQFADACRVAGEAAAAHGITIVIEPLNKRECNIINSVQEGYDLALRVGHPNVKLLADFYHMRLENESMNEIEKAGDMLQHFHIANSQGRGFPFNAEEDSYDAFWAAIQKIGYQGRLSIEGGTKDLDADGPAALAFLRRLVG